MRHSKYSVIVAGSGLSGLYAALKIEQQLKDLPNGILLITKSDLDDSNSYYAQGGMVAVLKDNTQDSVELHVSDTLKAGAGLSELNTTKFVSENSDKVVHDLLKFGVEFDRDENGNFTLTKEAAHSIRRILHSGGDATGREMTIALCKKVRENKNISLKENTPIVDISIKNNECTGIVVYNSQTNEYEAIEAPVVILATGGVGQLYKYTTNPSVATGDGPALCYRAGIELQDMEFVQFHPTSLADDSRENRFLISEAVRGEGAKLCDKDGHEFMYKYDERKELAPRDIVARSIFTEMEETNVPNVYLNATCIGKEKLLKRFPTIAKRCSEIGIDITKDFIPVSPAAHYFMGGVKTDLTSETSAKGLFAIGEVSSTGLHGANRLASNSLLECVVFAYEVADYLKNKKISEVGGIDENLIKKYEENLEFSEVEIEKLKTQLKEIMWENVGIFRNEKSLTEALQTVENISEKFGRVDKCKNAAEYELRNMLITARLIITSALNRKESRGAHYRTDYLGKSSICEHSLIKNNKGEISFAK